jgi:hypothetical protein
MIRPHGAAARPLALAAAITAACVVAAGGSAVADGGPAPALGVSLEANGACGSFADSLPALVARTGVRPGEEVGDVTLCATNQGHGAGALHVRVAERVELEAGCSGDEADGDPSCGGAGAGELGPALVQQVAVERCSRRGPPAGEALERALPDLESPVRIAGRLTPGHVVCVRLRLRYAPADTRAELASQSDSTSWRYVFDLVAAP